MEYITETEIIALRDQMSVEELRRITNETKAREGHVSFREIFKTMGYIHAFNDSYIFEDPFNLVIDGSEKMSLAEFMEKNASVPEEDKVDEYAVGNIKALKVGEHFWVDFVKVERV